MHAYVHVLTNVIAISIVSFTIYFVCAISSDSASGGNITLEVAASGSIIARNKLSFSNGNEVEGNALLLHHELPCTMSIR